MTPSRTMTGYIHKESHIITEVEVVVMRPKGVMEGMAVEFAIDVLQNRYKQMFGKQYRGPPE